jgi:transglycosylase-like protein with SLT domain
MAGFWDNAAEEPSGEDLATRQLAAESSGDPKALGPMTKSGRAKGLYQITDDTAKTYGVDPSHLFDPKVNRDVRDRYMNDLSKRYKGDTRLALAAYNWGPKNIDRVGGDESKWPEETRNYVKKVLASKEPAGKDFWSGAKEEPPEISAGASAGYDKNWFDTHTENVATKVDQWLSKKGHPDLGEAAHDLISKAAPHSATEAVVQAVSTILPVAGKLAPAVKEISPAAAKALEALEASGFKGSATRAAVTGAAGAATGGVPGAVQGLATSAGGDVLSAAGGKAAGVPKIEGQQMAAAVPEAAEQAAQGAVERRLDMTTAQARELAAPPVGPSTQASELAAAKVGVRTARTAARHEVGVLYDPIYQPINDLPVKPEAIDKIAAGARDQHAILLSRGNRELTKPTRDLLAEFGNLGDVDAGGTGRTSSVISPEFQGKTPITAAPTLGNTASKMGPRSFVDTQTGPEQVLTIRELRGRLQAIEKAGLRPGITEQERSALAQASIPIRQTLEDVVPDEQKPLLRSINDAYAQVSNAFPYQDLKPLRSASTLPELGKAFSDLNPNATRMVLDRMTPEQKALMAKAYASHLLHEDTTKKDIFNTLAKSDPALLKQLGFPDDFQKVGAWRDLVTSGRKIYDKPPDLMQSHEFIRGVRQGLRKQGVTPELMDQMTQAQIKGAAKGDGRMARMLQSGALWGSFMAAGGYAFGERRAAIAIPLLAGYYVRKAALNNPAYRAFVMNGYTRAGGDAFARLAGAGLVEAVKQYAAETGMIRPDKQQAAEEARP